MVTVKILTYLSIYAGMSIFVIGVALSIFIVGSMRRSRINTREMALALAGFERKRTTELEARAITELSKAGKESSLAYREKRMETDTHPVPLPLLHAALSRNASSDTDVSARAS